MLSKQYLGDLERRIIDRTEAEWPGKHSTSLMDFSAGPVLPGSATQALIGFTAHIAVEEVAKI